MPKESAGILLFRRNPDIQVFLVHPGGPYFARKDLGSWTIPKGEFLPSEEALEAAKREFLEETGFPVDGKFIRLPSIRQKGGKQVHAWALEGDIDPQAIRSNTFTIPWPPRSGKLQTFPEIDRAEWFGIAEAREKINPAQAEWLTGEVIANL
ncbi:NUDIX domain-containing protein [Parapedobacter lycopersici]|uniref:NUDIX domain-containing protein n=1 Tax=Parapedobacter lycopersici TaxID=1864939 RepID=UPI00214D3CE9|nr:NUDIX domain-containing protein [Parapedobacter lycopersici]